MSLTIDEANRKSYIDAIKHLLERSHRILKKDGECKPAWVNDLSLDNAKNLWFLLCDVTDAMTIQYKQR